MERALLVSTDEGLYCEPGGFFVDPWRPVDRAIITHAHADHACPGCGSYLTSTTGGEVLRARLGSEARIDTIAFGQALNHNGVQISLHPAGHILGSAQVRLEHDGMVWVASGDYILAQDSTCAPFEPLSCHVFLTESTFGLPIFRWSSPDVVFEEINAWWRENRARGKASLLCGYALGKAQRLLAGVDASIGPIYTHGAVERMNQAYRDTGVVLPNTTHVASASPATDWGGALIVAPPSAMGSSWSRRFGPTSSGLASGWMALRGARRRRTVDRGFVLSDHVDWPGLMTAIQETRAQKVLVTHGHVGVVVRWLREQGIDAEGMATRFEGEVDDDSAGNEEAAG
jgi:putative mRNA 3-end processing factor